MSGHERTMGYPGKETLSKGRLEEGEEDTRPGEGAPGEDATETQKGRRGERSGDLSDDALTEGISPLPARRLDTKTGEVREEKGRH